MTAAPTRPGPRLAPAPLLGAQAVFNIGFYAVVPFIAIVLVDEFALGASAVGLVLGVRTAAQQGMFLLGGGLADRFGARAVILAGCAVRVAGFGSLAVGVAGATPRLGLFIAGTVLTGLGGALFSPALSTLVSAAERERPAPSARRRHRPTLFALLTVVGESGAAIGPVLGSLLLGYGFAVVAASGAALFVLVALALSALLPRRAPGPAVGPGAVSAAASVPLHAWASLRDRRFVAFAVLNAVDLLAYNQLYFSVPVALRRAGGGAETLSALFVLVSLLTLLAQLPLNRLARRLGARAALTLGYGALAAAFLALGAGEALAPDGALAAVTAGVALLVTGNLLVGPTALGLVHDFAGHHRQGSYFGLLATAGGLAVLLGNALIGAVLPGASAQGWTTALPWIALAAVPALVALLAPRLVPAVAATPQITPEATASPLLTTTETRSS